MLSIPAVDAPDLSHGPHALGVTRSAHRCPWFLVTLRQASRRMYLVAPSFRLITPANIVGLFFLGLTRHVVPDSVLP